MLTVSSIQVGIKAWLSGNALATAANVVDIGRRDHSLFGRIGTSRSKLAILLASTIFDQPPDTTTTTTFYGLTFEGVCFSKTRSRDIYGQPPDRAFFYGPFTFASSTS
jgi:hypothetical protein